MAIINSVISWLMMKRFHQIELFMKYPHEVQNEWMKKLLLSAENTVYGKKYNFKNIKSYKEFKAKVPINDYNSLKPYIDRHRNGEQNVLWGSEIKCFAKSSGTSGDKSKYIPVSEESLEECHYKGGKDMLSIYFNNNPEAEMFDGRGLALGGSQTIREINNEEYYDGDLSAIIIDNLPFWAEFHRVPKRSVALMDDWEEKIEKMAEDSIPHDVRSISGVPSWTLLLLKRVLEKTGKKNILEVWPNMETFFHGGVNFEPYREQFKILIPSDTMIYQDTYTASEGFFGIQDRNGHLDLLLMLDYGIFYEFIPMDEFNNENHNIHSLEEVELGKNYAMVISTNAGLWRYVIGDTIEFTSLSPYRIRITGRTKNFINAFGEEVIIDNAEKAMNEACSKTKAIISEYTGAPVYFSEGKNAAHEWFIEFENEPENIEEFTHYFDNALQSLNSDYEAKRFKGMIIQDPIIHAVPQGTFYKWFKERGKLGGQNKVPRLFNDRSYVEEILKILK